MSTPGVLGRFGSSSVAVKVLVVNQLCFNVGFYMVLPFLATYLADDLGFAAWLVGLVLGVRVFSQQGLFIVGGSLADRLGYRPVIVAGCVVRTAGFASFALFSSAAGMVFAAVLTGFAAALFSPAVDAYLALESEDERADAFALFNVFGETGALLGPVVGIALLGFDFRVVCAAASVVFVVLAVVQVRYLPDREGGEANSEDHFLSDWKAAISNGRFVAFALAMAGYFILFNQMYLSLPFEVRRLTGGDALTGVMFALSSAITVMGQMWVTSRFARRHTPPRSIAIGMALMGLAFAPPMLTASILPVQSGSPATLVLNASPILASTVLITLGMMVAKPFAMDAIPALGGERRLGTYYGLYYAIGGIAAALGNSATGLLFDFARTNGFEALPWLLLTLVGLASAAGVTLLDALGKMPRKETGYGTGG